MNCGSRLLPLVMELTSHCATINLDLSRWYMSLGDEQPDR